MAQTRTYRLTLTPAKVDDRMVSFMMFDPNSRSFEVTASSLQELEGKIRRIAEHDFKQTCAVACSVPRGERKPAGFDKFRSSLPYIVVEG